MLGSAVALWMALAAADQPSGQVAIEIDLRKDGGALNRLVLGHNVEAADPKGIFGSSSDPYVTRTGTGVWDPEDRRADPDLLAAARAIGVPVVRYPGGCLAHGYRWKQTVGPVSSRPDFAFGLDEFLAYCRTLGALPLITVSDYSCTPEEAAQLVEYLNSPIAANKPYAQARARNGHPEPYGVVWFELGNESDHGNHELEPRTTWTPEQYADWFRACVRAMKAVDPRIRCGVVTSTTFPRWNSGWNEVVLRRTVAEADFAIVHCYSVGVTSEAQMQALPYEAAQQAPLASIDSFGDHLQAWRANVRRATGRDLPLAVTEFNAMFLQEKPKPLRFSLASALFCAGFVLDLAPPDAGVLLANYWQFANGYWGMVHSRGRSSLRRMPAFHVYELLAQGLRGRLVSVGRAGPRVEFNPGQSVGIAEPCWGEKAEPDAVVGPSLFQPNRFQPHSGSQASSSRQGEVFRLRLQQVSQELHLPLAAVDGPDGAVLEVSFQARFVGDPAGARIGLSVLDRRGWEPCHSGVAVEGAENAPNWTNFSGRLDTLSGSRGCLLAWRVLPGARPVSGVLEIRGLAVRVVLPGHRAGYPALQYVACRETGKSEGSVLLLNRDHRRSHEVRLSVTGGKLRSVEARCVSGDRLDDTNLDAENVAVRPLAARMEPGGRIRAVLPAASLTHIRIQWSNP